jgi:acetyltransferase-like isoleucine patch superfamily enzyme
MSSPPYFVHPSSDVQTTAIGAGTRIWQYVVALEGARIGSECNVCSHCFIEADVTIGDRVTIKSGVQLWNGVTLEDDVFVGPNVSFTNDRHPRSGNRGFRLERTTVARNASIGAGAVLLPGIRVGVGATVGAGAVVTRDVPDGATVVGNPARIVGSSGAGVEELR